MRQCGPEKGLKKTFAAPEPVPELPARLRAPYLQYSDVMRLAEFILKNREPILAEWEAFARTCAPASGSMDITALRDHANEMLTVIADDLQTPQNKAEQSEKGKGQGPTDSATTAAEEHGAGRAESGFTVEQMVSEYRALRASVIRLWTASQGELKPDQVEDLTRFNEAIDQSLAESVQRYTQDLDHSKEMFLAILGHDLRTPIGAVMTSAKFMLDTKELKEPHLTLTSRIASSSARMNSLVGDLLDFTRSRLGSGIPVDCEEIRLEKVVQDVVDEVSAAHPDRVIETDIRSEQIGNWDCARISQVLTNLVGNALEHGSPRTKVCVTLDGDAEGATIAVHNLGPAIPADLVSEIFHPMKRIAAGPDKKGPTANLGLGLYIADRIVAAHHGTIDVDSSESKGTTFTVRLPRRL
jgi:signal transduction histidine kinase